MTSDRARSGGGVLVRKATVDDVKSIHRLISEFSDDKVMLPRSLSELYDNVRDPYQQKNLTNAPEHAALQARMEALTGTG